MPVPSVTLEVVRGSLEGSEFVFTGPASCIVGRADDCDIRLPASPDNIDVSRHHCCFEINPPFVRVRDLQSLNGTYVNDRLIGCRGAAPSVSDDTGIAKVPFHLLNDGDEIRVGGMIVSVTIFDPEEAALAEAGAMEMA